MTITVGISHIKTGVMTGFPAVNTFINEIKGMVNADAIKKYEMIIPKKPIKKSITFLLSVV